MNTVTDELKNLPKPPKQ